MVLRSPVAEKKYTAREGNVSIIVGDWWVQLDFRIRFVVNFPILSLPSLPRKIDKMGNKSFRQLIHAFSY